MKTLLINPFGMNQYGKVRYLSVFPLGLGQLLSASILKGFDVKILDCDIDKIRPESPEFVRSIVDLNPGVVGVSYWSFNKYQVLKTLTVVKKNLRGVVTVVGGPEPTATGEKCVEDPVIDFAFRGEAEVGFPMLLDVLNRSQESFSGIPGLIYRKNKKVYPNPQVFPEDLDSFGHVDYEVLQLRKYHEYGYRYGLGKCPSAPIQATRGCPFQCQFCSGPRINGTKVRAVSVSHLVTDIHRLYHDFGVRMINLIDDNFTLNRSYAIDVCRAIEEAHLKDLTMASPNGIHLDTIDSELMEAMSRAGWVSLMVAPETGSENTLARMRKKVNLSDVPRKIKIIKSAGIVVGGSFIIGYADETPDDINLTAKFIQKCDFDVISINKFQPLPGTPIFDELARREEIDSDFVPVDTIGPSKYAPNGMTCAQLDWLHKKIYLSFFLKSPMKSLRTLQSAGIARAYKRLRWLFQSQKHGDDLE